MPIIEIDLEQAVTNSYRNFHAKGLDYICLSRSDELTQKLYILDGDASKVPEVVNPHDHRYSFVTTVLHGKMADYRWRPGLEGMPGAKPFSAFDYMTPLNGGSGFIYRGEEWLVRTVSEGLRSGESLATQAKHIHTIQMMADQTVLRLDQFADVYPIDKATSTWSRGENSPSCTDDGLYERFTEGQLVDRLKAAGFETREVSR